MEKTYQIRYNTHSKNDLTSWRLICDDEEILVDEEVVDAFNLFKCLSPQQRQHAIAHIRFLTSQDKSSG